MCFYNCVNYKFYKIRKTLKLYTKLSSVALWIYEVGHVGSRVQFAGKSRKLFKMQGNSFPDTNQFLSESNFYILFVKYLYYVYNNADILY